MAKRRNSPSSNPLLKDRVTAIMEQGVGTTKRQLTEAEHYEQAVETGHNYRFHDGRWKQVDADSRRRRERKVQIKARVSQNEAEQIERLTRTLSAYVGTKINGSEITRALWSLAIRSQDELASVIDHQSLPDRPSNGNPLRMAQFEDTIAELLLLAMKRTCG